MQDLIAEAGKCVNCGFCESVCPTLPAAGFISTKGARGRVDLAKFLYNKGEIDPSESFYSCVDCYACLSVCPAGVNAGKVSEIGRMIVAEQGKAPEIAKMIVEFTMKFKNPLGVREKCAEWASGIEFGSKETLLYTGNMYQLMAYLRKFGSIRKLLGHYDSAIAHIMREHPSFTTMFRDLYDRSMMGRMSDYLRNIVKLLKQNGIEFGYLGKEEPYPGTFIYDLGFENEFREYAKYVSELFRSHGVRRIITIDPHTYEILKYIYPKYVNFEFDVIYYMDMIKIDRVAGKYAVHAPCHFSRYFDFTGYVSKIFDAYTEENPTRCCGGPDELLFPEISERISQKRFEELKSTGYPIVTACPICYANLAKDDSVMDISELLLKSK
ncbi:heterodisulfide reductase related protein [Thermoplasma acidophilum]|uniref:Heterodisulfide reductase related protein n=1 Tax=Thermoplasma acidophilum (strain ATCC 25905 / DSM 1728 / JCM 9062 / NBRC 15155 / AMRC-C165) TaxID=273075 RepID=Q9HKQ5_THEAC|nr:(Fe-S)-binding protein [Thermoplasma acidophilum]MCY0852365.1 (Fe-S)-binding protein [Thermoplasma acidophilum]CAC11681.1 heterodisulfide reductase related protein [Thermoplasma acidophilum]